MKIVVANAQALVHIGDMTDEIKQAVKEVKTAKATAMFWENVKTYGRESAALRALDCISREEAIQMLSVVQNVSIFKRDGKVVVQ